MSSLLKLSLKIFVYIIDYGFTQWLMIYKHLSVGGCGFPAKLRLAKGSHKIAAYISPNHTEL